MPKHVIGDPARPRMRSVEEVDALKREQTKAFLKRVAPWAGAVALCLVLLWLFGRL